MTDAERHPAAPATAAPMLSVDKEHYSALLAATTRKLRHSAWARSICFGISSFTSLVISASYADGLPNTATPGGLYIINDFGGLKLWSVLWLISGLIGFAAVISGRRAAWVIVLQASFAGYWAICYLLGWIFYGGRGYLSGVLFLLIDALTLAMLLLPWDRKPSWDHP